MRNPVLAAAVVLAVAMPLLACSGDGGRWLSLRSERVSGLNRICTYADGLGEYALTLHSWDRCEPSLELDE